MKLALIQMAARTEKEESLRTAEDFLKRAKEEGADVAMLPEMFDCPYQSAYFPVYAEPDGGPSWERMSRAAKENGIWLIAGTMPERDAEGRIYNTAYVFDREGRQAAKHRKMHLFDVRIAGGQQFCESDTLTAGSQVTTFDTEFGRFGLMICYDIRFPELARLLALQGANMIFVPAAFNMTTGPAHWQISFRMRALDNQVFLAGCSQARQEEGYISYGHSMIASPWADVIAEMDEKEGLLLQEIDLTETERIREQLPLLRQRRTDVYSLEWKG